MLKYSHTYSLTPQSSLREAGGGKSKKKGAMADIKAELYQFSKLICNNTNTDTDIYIPSYAHTTAQPVFLATISQKPRPAKKVTYLTLDHELHMYVFMHVPY